MRLHHNSFQDVQTDGDKTGLGLKIIPSSCKVWTLTRPWSCWFELPRVQVFAIATLKKSKIPEYSGRISVTGRVDVAATGFTNLFRN